ncbi:MAG: UDP-N-acetylmuramoyl-L-alanyl-D-glutamate--2,6-diaminopimelate ligase [Candidatus Omnitrophota bacterium]
MEKAKRPCGRITTIDYNAGAKSVQAGNTTPGAEILNKLFSDMLEAKLQYCVMEVSSHALHQKRTLSIKFNSAAFTNLSPEHLDYHKTMDEYFLCKKILFDQLDAKKGAIVNIDDKYGKKLASLIKRRMITYGFSEGSNVKASKADTSVNGTSFLLSTPKGETKIHTSLIGRHNIYNILCAVSLALNEGIALDVIKEAAQEFRAPCGRLDKVKPDNKINVYVDYAHTDDALEKVLICLAQIKKTRLITVFGCGGDRDKTKRARMGKVAANLSDIVIITSDNPRSENPKDIINQIKEGIPADFKNYIIEQDRARAIKKAIGIAKKGDIVLIAGKGHETYQILKNKVIPFNDKRIAQKCLRLKK